MWAQFRLSYTAEDSSAQHFIPFHVLCSTVCEMVFCYVDVTVAAEDQYVLSRVRTDGEWSRFNGISVQESCNYLLSPVISLALINWFNLPPPPAP